MELAWRQSRFCQFCRPILASIDSNTIRGCSICPGYNGGGLSMKRNLFRPIIALGFAVLAIGSAQAQSFDYASVDFPNAVRTRAWGINPGGVIVGDYRDGSNISHGFVLSGGHFITVDVPGSVLGL